ncbi:MAG: cell division protein FtsA [Deltaproteobacteria bacterium CG2_30_63_29]|nr:MAG: cell division protein FtsA [Deltaproteobacteria bacterium CG2_30_63_29]PIW00125.1 MAG: cell division protein FtsA [Deltaproteobacteria bacterium CG17_big_fil_post_rev_8_21_14_2_50_63_7]PJB34081.1 MAG: cell division protein FtsA [Deltaproteobacteria bacterium CG_4_9_14_3_um_filter_63_12]
MAKRGDLLVGLDIGTTKVCAIIGEVTENGIDIIGIGTQPSKGLRKGVVINIDSTVNSIKRAVEEAELMAGCEVSHVFAGIAGGHIKGFNSTGVVAVRDRESVKQSDIVRVIDAAKAVAIPLDREVLHVIPQEYIIDEQDGIHEPVGMSGVRLEAKVHIVTGSVTSAQNIVKCANRCNLNVSDIVLEQLASSEAVLSDDEKELGCAMVDIGGGTTDIAIWSKGTIVHTSVLSVGGNHLTNDIAVGLRTPMAEAERIKQRGGCAMVSMIGADETIEVPSVGGRAPRELPRRILAEIIEPRVEEIFALVFREIEQSGYADLIASGVVITGGTTILEGMPELAEQVLQMPVRRGLPRGVGGLVDVVKSPKYATGVGLVLYGAKNPEKDLFTIREEKVFQKVKRRMVSWFREIV